MQPLTAGLAGATCSQVVVQCGIGTCASEGTRKIVGVRCVAPVSFCSRTCFVRWNSQGIARRTNEGLHGVFATFPSRRSLKATAATEDETLDLLTLEAQPEAEPEQEAATEEESVASKEDTSPKTNVKFLLQKECHFGQQFNVVGEIPELGEWDPSRAVPMVWSEGHVWSAELPIQVGLTVKHKFVLTGKRLELVWQPGEDKVFETNDESDIIVSGFWDDALPVEDFPPDTTGEADDTAGEDSEKQEVAASTNGLATGSADSDLKEALVVLGEAADADTTTEEGSGSIDVVSAEESEQEEEPEESPEIPEIPVVDAALATVVAEVSGEVEDAAAAKEI